MKMEEVSNFEVFLRSNGDPKIILDLDRLILRKDLSDAEKEQLIAKQIEEVIENGQ